MLLTGWCWKQAQAGREVTGCGSTHSDRLPGWRGGRRGGEEEKEKERGATDPQLRMIICLGRKSLFHCIVTFLLLNYFPPQFHQQPITTWTHNSFCTLGQPVRLNQPWTKMSARRDSNLLFLTGVCLLGRATTVSCVEEEHSRWHTASFNGTKYRVVPPQKRSTTGTSDHHVQLNENFRKPAALLHLMLMLMLMTKMILYYVRDSDDASTGFITGQSILVQCHCQTTSLCHSTTSPRRSWSLCNSSPQP